MSKLSVSCATHSVLSLRAVGKWLNIPTLTQCGDIHWGPLKHNSSMEGLEGKPKQKSNACIHPVYIHVSVLRLPFKPTYLEKPFF